MMRESISTSGTGNGGICLMLRLTETRHGAGECGSGEVHPPETVQKLLKKRKFLDSCNKKVPPLEP